jgi:hypothetical protein
VTPKPNTPESTAWHNQALEMARERLPKDAPLGKVLQLAAKIQHAGPQPIVKLLDQERRDEWDEVT